METKTFRKISPTNDLIIRSALKKDLKIRYSKEGEKFKIIEELGIRHGSVRIDIAVVNGIMHGYEIKSDLDTLRRLPDQMREFNAVFDQLTLVVGKQHLYQAMQSVPNWWGIKIAKINSANKVIFQTIREPEENKKQESVSIARLLWRGEALRILEEHGLAEGVRSRPREFIYARMEDELDIETLKSEVRDVLLNSRGDWRSVLQPV